MKTLTVNLIKERGGGVEIKAKERGKEEEDEMKGKERESRAREGGKGERREKREGR